MLKQNYDILESLMQPNGLYLASPSADYSYVWIRDSIYMSLPYLDKSCDTYERTYWGLLDLFKKYKWKIEIHTKQKPAIWYEYIHSRYFTDGNDVSEMGEEWGHNQLDAIGAFLWGVGKGVSVGKKIIRDDEDLKIVRLIVKYLECVEYWHEKDHGMWEENLEIHTSSIGACVAGLMLIHNHVMPVSMETIKKGYNILLSMIPHGESVSKTCDLAQLSLIYPYNILPVEQQYLILDNVGKHLIRRNGVIRYIGDSYYSALKDNREKPMQAYRGHEAEWTFGLPWLTLCYMQLESNTGIYSLNGLANHYLKKTEKVMLENGALPELYIAGTDEYNPNTPLGWSSAMYILAKEQMGRI